LVNFSMILSIVSVSAVGGWASRYFSELRTKLRYFMVGSSGWGFDQTTNETSPVSFFAVEALAPQTQVVQSR
jgi:hypothetical protein